MHHVIYYLSVSYVLLLNTHLSATAFKVEETNPISADAPKTYSKEELKLLSQSYGNIIGQNICGIDLDLDPTDIIIGIQNALNGIEPPLDESKTIAMISDLQERKFKAECDHNLKAAEAFLASNINDAKVVELEKGKLQYKQIVEGKGEICKEIHTPIVTYVGKYLDGMVFGKSTEAEPINLTQTIEGFQKALIGMKVGETREVYIHPDMGYGTNGNLSPNSLLTFEICLKELKEKSPAEEADLSLSFPEDAFAETNLNYQNVK